MRAFIFFILSISSINKKGFNPIIELKPLYKIKLKFYSHSIVAGGFEEIS